MAAFYNEFDPFAAAWLRELIKDGLIADGVVDERSIADVRPEDLEGFTQCHFFAGIGGWSAAARIADWDDERPMWTGSPPCQPFSTAGNRKGKDDLRHLWPVFFNLIRECRPPVVFGEQVAAAIRTGWFDDLQTDMEAEGYATAMVVLPACSVGAPHKRERLWTVAERLADTKSDRDSRGLRQVPREDEKQQTRAESRQDQAEQCEYGSESSRTPGNTSGMGNAEHNGQHGSEVRRSIVAASNDDQKRPDVSIELEGASRPKITRDLRNGEDTSGMANPNSAQCEGGRLSGGTDQKHAAAGSGSTFDSCVADSNDIGQSRQGEFRRPISPAQDVNREVDRVVNAGACSNFWERSKYIHCRDGKDRQIPIEPALFPLAHGIPNRVGLLRGAGNAIVPQVAAEIIGSYMECR